MLTRAGIPVDPGDPRGGARLLVESGTFLCGAPVDALLSYAHAGVDEVVLNATAVNLVQSGSDTVRQLTDLIDRLQLHGKDRSSR